MKKRRELYHISLILVIFFGLMAMGCSSGSEESTNVEKNGGTQMGSEDANVYEKSRMLGRAVNLGNALEAPYEGAWDMFLEEKYFKLIKDKGFDSVRIPIRYSNKTTNNSPYTIDESFMKRVDWAVEQSLLQNLNVIVDLHHFDEMLTDPAGNKERFLSIWRQVSKRYSSQPGNVYYEVLNEPNAAITADIWNEYLAEAIKVIRQNDPHRTLIIGGVDWNSINGLEQLKLPEDDRNIIATFHYYGPILFTHQGAEWMTGEYGTTGLVWPGPPASPVQPNEAAKQVDWVRNFFQDYNTKQSADNPASREALTRDLERAAAWGKANNRPIFLGEFGVYRTADLASRVSWTKAVRTEAERLGMSWAYWEFGAGFGVYDRAASKWNEQLIEALFSSQ